MHVCYSLLLPCPCVPAACTPIKGIRRLVAAVAGHPVHGCAVSYPLLPLSVACVEP